MLACRSDRTETSRLGCLDCARGMNLSHCPANVTVICERCVTGGRHHVKKRHASFVRGCTLVTGPIANSERDISAFLRLRHAKEREQMRRTSRRGGVRGGGGRQ